MRVHGLKQRARPFRYAGFWLMAALCLLHGRNSEGLTASVLGTLFCIVWPVAVDRLLRHPPRRFSPLTFELTAYVLECAMASAVLVAVGLPWLCLVAAWVCLLAGAMSLAGLGLLLPAAAAALLGGAAGALAGGGVHPGGLTAADALALVLIFGFTLALAHLSFEQAQRLDAQRLALALRSAELERINRRLGRYLPPSLRDRVTRDPDRPCRWERRWLTVAFVDLVGFTELADTLEAEPLSHILDDYLGALLPAVDAAGGEVSKLLGDGVMIVFGLHGGDDRRAPVAAAMGLCQQVPDILARLAAGWRRRGDVVVLQARCGLASGFCTLGDRGGAERLDFTLIGSAVNLASRLQAHAPVNGMLMDEATAALAEDRWSLSAPRELTIKGLGNLSTYALS